jgi:hypothetical protein
MEKVKKLKDTFSEEPKAKSSRKIITDYKFRLAVVNFFHLIICFFITGEVEGSFIVLFFYVKIK